MTANRTAYA